MSSCFFPFKVSVARWQASHEQSAQTVVACGSWGARTEQVALVSVQEAPTHRTTSPPLDEACARRAAHVCSLPHTGAVEDLAFISDDTFVTASSRGRLHAFTFASPLSSEDNKWQFTEQKLNCDVKFNAAATSLAFEPLTGTLASGGADGQLCLLDIARWSAQTLTTPSPLLALALASVNTLLSADLSGCLRVWDVRCSSCVACSRSSLDALTAVAAPASGFLVATGGEDGSVAVWDRRKLDAPCKWNEIHLASVWELAFSPHGPSLVSVGDDGAVLVSNGTAEKEGGVKKWCATGLSLNSVHWNRLWRSVCCAGDGREVLFFDETR